MNQTKAPFSDLSPDLILDAVDSLGLNCDGRLLALNSYENRVYQIGVEEGSPLVVKFYRPGRWSDEAILEEHHFLQSLVNAEIPVAAPILSTGDKSLHYFGGYRFSLFTKHPGRAPELDQPGILQWIGRFIGRIHAVGVLENFNHRPTLDIASFGIEPSQYLQAHGFIPLDLEMAYASVVKQALDGVQRCFDRAGDVVMLRLHGDCHPGNVLWTDMGPHFVDFDDSRMGPAVQDLWMLISGERQNMQNQMQELLKGYECFCDFNPREIYLVEALRTLRLIYYAAWIARRWDDPAFPQAFPWFNTQHYWQNRILELREQIALMDEPPLALL